MNEIPIHSTMKKLVEILLKLQALEATKPASAAGKQQMAELRAQIPLPVLGHYDRLVARGKKGVAIIRHQVCSACHMQVPRGVEIILMHGDDLQLCENCGAYLALPESPEPAAVEPPAKPKIKRAPRKVKAALQTV
jgi:predicted  nucleic acid-binding Zn-ribbon protein